MAKVAVAMSGGVDSSVAAALLLEEGHELLGLTMQLSPPESAMGACSNPVAVIDAQKVASQLKIPHKVVSLEEDFSQTVIANFCNEYQRGRTPNPCIRCNEKIKFGLLLEAALREGADYLATGHYLKVQHNRRHLLYRGNDKQKDQRYFLAGLTQKQLQYVLFPLGELVKDETRALAEKFNLVVAKKAESQENCFISDDYRTFPKGRIEEKPGKMVDLKGNVLREHEGITNFTIGQRRNLGLGDTGKRYFVLALDPQKQRVIVGPKEELSRSALLATAPNLIPFDTLEGPLKVKAQIRYRTKASPAIVTPFGGGVRVDFERAQNAITPGQAVVFYDGDLVIGRSTILKAL